MQTYSNNFNINTMHLTLRTLIILNINIEELFNINNIIIICAIFDVNIIKNLQ